MFDPTPMFPKLYHPMSLRNNRNFKGTIKFSSRTSRPVKYYFIDFGISSMYPAEDPHPREVPIFSGDKSAPEYRTPTQPCDSYALDVYLLGSAIRQDVLMVCPFIWRLTFNKINISYDYRRRRVLVLWNLSFRICVITTQPAGPVLTKLWNVLMFCIIHSAGLNFVLGWSPPTKSSLAFYR